MPTDLLTRSQLSLIDDDVQEEARAALNEIGDLEPDNIQINAQGTQVILDEGLSQFFFAVLGQLATGAAVGVQSLPEELTTTTAAELLGVSRTTLMKLVKAEKIPSYKVKSHTRLRVRDVLEYKRERHAARRAALEKLLELEQQHDL